MFSTQVGQVPRDSSGALAYTDRGHDKLFRKFVERRVEKFFRTARVAAFLLHPVAHPGTPGRLEQVSKEERKKVRVSEEVKK